METDKVEVVYTETTAIAQFAEVMPDLMVLINPFGFDELCTLTERAISIPTSSES